jgi:hypothetical protein
MHSIRSRGRTGSGSIKQCLPWSPLV